jgi:exodeoxyribonuclease V alpha subunit
MMFLHSNGVGTARAVRIYKTYGPDAVQAMTENPYRLTGDVRGIGFALAEAMDEGHCGLPTGELISLAQSLLEAPAEMIRIALDLELPNAPWLAIGSAKPIACSWRAFTGPSRPSPSG